MSAADEALDVLSTEFDGLYVRHGRPSIAPEKLLRASLLQAFYSVRSERQLMEQLDYNLLSRRFVGLAMAAPVWDASTFNKNRERLLAGESEGLPRASRPCKLASLPARTLNQTQPRRGRPFRLGTRETALADCFSKAFLPLERLGSVG